MGLAMNPIQQNGFQLDLNLCTGCEACSVACVIENELPWDSSWRWVDTFNEDHLPGVPLYHLSLACNHCEDAPCMHHCPALAYYKDSETGAVLLDPDACIGCKYCTWACPYDAPRYDASAGVVSKCNFCHHRQVEGLAPACVSQCPTGALQFGELTNLEGTEGPAGFPQTEAKPSIRFVEARGSAPQQGLPVSDLADLVVSLSRRTTKKASLKTEWPLLGFSLLCAFLVGAMATLQGREFLQLPGFLLLAGSAGLASSFHLGQKTRAWRAILNWRRSWVSREILAFAGFGGLSVLYYLSGSPAIGATVGILGFGLLFAIDRVYFVTRMPELSLHSAQVLLTGVQVAGLAGAHPGVFLGATSLKLVLYLRRSWRLRGSASAVSRLMGAVRVILGLILPVPLLVLGGEWTTLAIWGLVILGESIDRIQFYQELRIPTPRGQIEEDLGRVIRVRRAA